MAGEKTLTHFGITTTKGIGLMPGIKRHDLTEQCYGYHRPTIRVKGHEINVKGYMEAQSHPAGVSCSKAERRSFLNAAGEKLSYVGTYRTDGCSGLATDAFGKSNGENCCHLCFAGVRSNNFVRGLLRFVARVGVFGLNHKHWTAADFQARLLMERQAHKYELRNIRNKSKAVTKSKKERWWLNLASKSMQKCVSDLQSMFESGNLDEGATWFQFFVDTMRNKRHMCVKSYT
jgi:hypothetical protein